jgi:hypothetical protein
LEVCVCKSTAIHFCQTYGFVPREASEEEEKYATAELAAAAEAAAAAAAEASSNTPRYSLDSLKLKG